MEDYNKVFTLKTIAEVLNQSNERKPMLQSVLESFLNITHFEAGWIFLGEHEMELVADYGLPEALIVNDKEPMCGSDMCYCLSSYKQGRLEQAFSILTCKRLEQANRESKYHTGGFTHHATVALQDQNKKYGVFNVTAPNRTQFHQDELDLLQSIAEQITYALIRIELFEAEEKRVKLLESLHHISTELRQIESYDDLKHLIDLTVINSWILGCEIHVLEANLMCGNKTSYQIHIDLPTLSGEIIFFSNQNVDEQETEFLNLLAQYIELTIKSIQLKERERNIIQIQEREALAQDLHDTVNQLLYSMTATSSALKTMNQDESLNEPIQLIHSLSQQALNEMRQLIEDKQSNFIKKGLVSALNQYATQIGLTLNWSTKGVKDIPVQMEEALYKVGREAIHNIYKHASVQKASLKLIRDQEHIQFQIQDHGLGFDTDQVKTSFGLVGIKDRVNKLGGKCEILSKPERGTKIDITIPV